jgi:hypothetical protein
MIAASPHRQFGVSHVITTINIGTCVSVQGLFVKRLPNGMVCVKVDGTIYTGRPVSAAA